MPLRDGHPALGCALASSVYFDLCSLPSDDKNPRVLSANQAPRQATATLTSMITTGCILFPFTEECA